MNITNSNLWISFIRIMDIINSAYLWISLIGIIDHYFEFVIFINRLDYRISISRISDINNSNYVYQYFGMFIDITNSNHGYQLFVFANTNYRYQ